MDSKWNEPLILDNKNFGLLDEVSNLSTSLTSLQSKASRQKKIVDDNKKTISFKLDIVNRKIMIDYNIEILQIKRQIIIDKNYIKILRNQRLSSVKIIIIRICIIVQIMLLFCLSFCNLVRTK